MSNETGRDPYLGLLNMFRSEADGRIPLYFCLGKILEISETSLRIQADGQELDQDDVLINDMLRWNFREEAKITLDSPGMEMSGRFYGASSPCPAGSGHSYFDVTKVEGYRIHDKTATYQVESRLKAGDLVLLIPDRERQIYYLIMKVVSYGAVSAD